MATSDSFSPYDPLLTGALTDPWTHHSGQPPRYNPDHDLLGQLLSVPIAAGAVSESGSFANGIDSWIAQELRRAGSRSPTATPAGRDNRGDADRWRTAVRAGRRGLVPREGHAWVCAPRAACADGSRSPPVGRSA